ncbi:MAG: hypothetical protein SXU28_12325 [Pseudomonadota bacterium]|nr:hypothetical protein [Pseudomonadota bacterium]
MNKPLILIALSMIAAPLSAKESLGVYGQWAAFKDDDTARCYAIAAPRGSNSDQSFISIGTWPKKDVRGQVHVRLKEAADPKRSVRLSISGETFDLVARGRNAWPADKAGDAAIIAAMRSTGSLSVSAQSASGSRFTSRYSLDGAATAMDAATVGCADA